MAARIKDLRKFGFNTNKRTYVIAEIGINHGGDVALARQLIDAAARSGADGVKFQTYLTEKRAPKNNQAVFDILKQCELPFEAFRELQSHAAERRIDFFSTVFDQESLEYLEGIGCCMYKAASFDVVNHQLLAEISKTGRPVVLSVGMAALEEVQAAYRILKEGTSQISLLHCISAYPTRAEDANLAAIYALQDQFDCVIGQSDHTSGIQVPLYAVAAGAQVIEKHFRIDEGMECVDAPVSITEAQMKKMMEEISRLEQMFGDGRIGLTEPQKGSQIFRRPSK